VNLFAPATLTLDNASTHSAVPAIPANFQFMQTSPFTQGLNVEEGYPLDSLGFSRAEKVADNLMWFASK
jgi:glutamine cyclotransferase